MLEGGVLVKIEVAADKPTVNRIVEAAIPLFAIKGVSSVSVKEVAEAAGVNVALISYYFGGKDNLYAFVLEQQLSILGDTIDRIKQEECCPVGRIRRMAVSLAVLHRQNPYSDRLFFSEVTNPTKCFDMIVRKAADRLHQFLRDCIIEAIDLGKFRPDLHTDFAAVSLIKILNVSFITLLLTNKVPTQDEDPIEVYTQQALDIYLRGVSNPNEMLS